MSTVARMSVIGRTLSIAGLGLLLLAFWLSGWNPAVHADDVALVSFTAVSLPGLPEIYIEWETATEIDTAGFFVARSDSYFGPFTRVSEFIPHEGDAVVGAQYAFLDEGTVLNQAYYYRLEVINTDQSVNYHGPIPAVAGAAPPYLLGMVTGIVVDGNGPIERATVRVRATDNFTHTSSAGYFTLGSLIEGQKVEVTAWAEGYYVAHTYVTPTVSGLTLTLRRYHTTDHPAYTWPSPISGTSAGACGNCHPMIVSQWITNGHGGATFNPRFYSLYNGTDLTGTLSIGPGYLNDFPGTAGNCANCHAPGAGVDGYLNTDMNRVRESITATIHCDYCHKIGGVYLNPATGSVYPNAPGVRSQQILRPPPGDNVFFGPYDDIHDPDTRLPLISESAYCAPCHQFSMWGTPIYESFSEWLNSPYAEAGITCQKCHMPPNGDTYFALPAAGGLAHPPDRIPSHLDRGAADIDLLQNSVTMTVSARQIVDRIEVTAIITNANVGHHVPTDHPGRQMILTVHATDAQGHDLIQQAGEVVPAWGGAQAGTSGKVFAKILQDVATGEAPVVSYWKQTRILSDTRLAALQTDTSMYTFAVPADGEPIMIMAELRFRRAFQELMGAKGWDSPDILMEEMQVTVTTVPVRQVYLPLILK